MAGPIVNQTVKLTNLSWKISAKILKKEPSLKNILLINDFSAIGYAINHLGKDDYMVLQEAKKG